jgi:hypothetical protein
MARHGGSARVSSDALSEIEAVVAGWSMTGARLLKFPILTFNKIGQPAPIYPFRNTHVGNLRLAPLLFGEDNHLRGMRRRESDNKGVRA